jgi:alpha-L-fucosidase
VPLSGDRTKFKCQELYDHIHRLQPQVLVCCKQGLLGTEDFFAPEREAVEDPSGKPMEICSTLPENSWGCHKRDRHISTDEAWAKLVLASTTGANLLLNTGRLYLRRQSKRYRPQVVRRLGNDGKDDEWE